MHNTFVLLCFFVGKLLFPTQIPTNVCGSSINFPWNLRKWTQKNVLGREQTLQPLFALPLSTFLTDNTIHGP